MDAKISADKRARVLSAAERVFLQQGYAPTTMGDLAAAAGMSRPALYLVYARKHELFSAVIRDEAEGESAGRPSGDDIDGLQHWMTWVCDLWLGETVGPPPASPHSQRSESSPREVAFLQSILQAGLRSRLPWAVDESVCVSVARLLTFCVCGLLDSRVAAAERRVLLAVQIDALAEIAARARHAEPGFSSRSAAGGSKKSHATARAMAAR